MPPVHAARERPGQAEQIEHQSSGRPARFDGVAQLLRLQAAVGNRAVVGVVESLVAQRQQPGAGPVPTDRAAADALHRATDLEALLAQIDALMPSPERVAPFEVLSATTAAEYSSGELEREIQRLWRRERLVFTAAARRAVATPARGRAATGTASTRLQPERQYQLRRALNLFAADYRTGSDLPDVARVARRGSPFRRAVAAEFDEPTTVLNPTGAQIERSIFDAMLGLWIDLKAGDVGQLVVSFSGHGGGGFISGVDWQRVGADRLEALASLAADHNVHVVFVLDTCRAGMVVDWAQRSTILELGARIGRLPDARRGELSARHAFLTELARASTAVGVAAHQVGDMARQLRRRRSDANRLAYVEALLALSRNGISFGDVVRGSAVPPDLPHLEALRERQQELGFGALTGTAEGPGGSGAVLRQAARLLDAANDTLGAALATLDADTRAAGEGSGQVGEGRSAQPVR